MDKWQSGLLHKCREFVGDEPLVAISESNPVQLMISQAEAYIIMKLLEKLEPGAELRQ